MPITIVLAMPGACLRRIVHANSRVYFPVRGFASFSPSLGRTGASTTRMSQAAARLQEKSTARKSNPVGAWSGLERRCRPGVIHERRSPQRSCTHLPTAASFLPSPGRTYAPLRDWMIIGPDVFAGRRKKTPPDRKPSGACFGEMRSGNYAPVLNPVARIAVRARSKITWSFSLAWS